MAACLAHDIRYLVHACFSQVFATDLFGWMIHVCGNYVGKESEADWAPLVEDVPENGIAIRLVVLLVT